MAAKVSAFDLARRGQEQNTAVPSPVESGLQKLDEGALKRAVIEHGTSMVIGTFQFQRLGLDIKGSPTYEQWRSIGETLLFMATGAQWWIGDWLAYGERVYGRTYEEVAAETGRKRATLYNYVWVAKSVDISLRRENLSFEHHKIVAGLLPSEQAKLLSQAEEGNWSTRRLQEVVDPPALPGDVPRYSPAFERRLQGIEDEFAKAGQGGKVEIVEYVEQTLDKLRRSLG